MRVVRKQWQIAAKYRRLLERAAVELQHKEESRLSPGNVLTYLVDLRVSTSDLEDRFRVDPLLHSKEQANDRNDQIDAAMTDLAQGGGHMMANGIQDDDVYVAAAQPPAETWYGIPLFGTSAYQQEIESSFDLTDGTFGVFGHCQIGH